MIGALALGSMFAAGVAGSLHCIGMCGPILAALTGAVDRPGQGRAALVSRLFSYHGGRIWTYAVLGCLAGIVGDSARRGMNLQRPLALAMAVMVVASGVFLLTGFGAGRWVGGRTSCGGALAAVLPWLRRGVTARVVAGAVMGLIPCGLVYAMLVMVAAFHDPLSGALGMAAFGLGTVPSLSAVVVGSRLVSPLVRAQGARAVAIGLIVAGAWMGYRAVTTPTGGACCHEPVAAAPTHTGE